MGTAEQKVSVRVNDGPETEITVRTGVYRDIAAAVPAILGFRLPIDVHVWVPSSGMTLDSFSASNMRHVVEGVRAAVQRRVLGTGP